MPAKSLKDLSLECIEEEAVDLAHRRQSPILSDEQKKKAGGALEDGADLALDIADTVDADLAAVALRGVSKAAAGLGDIATGALHVAGDVVAGTASAVGEVASVALEGVASVIGAFLD